MDPFIAQIIMFGGNFAPRGWALCNGQLLPISQYSALFSILGTTYGGDGRTTFGLPDLRGRVPVHPGNGPGLSNYRLGEKGGRETNVLNITQLPSHNHTATGKVKTGGDDNLTDTSAGNLLASEARGGGDALNIYNNGAATGNMADNGVEVTVGNTGSSQPVNNIQPFNTVNFIIALYGTYPSRS